MNFFIDKLFNGTPDELVHLQFQKYSRGVYEHKAILQAKNMKGKYSIGMSSEYANELVRALAEELGSKKTHITGVIVTTKDLSSTLPESTMTQFMGVKRFELKQELSGNELLKLLDEQPTAFFALSFATETSELKTKPKSPKSGKPSNKDEEMPKADFCKLKTTNKTFATSLLFGAEDAKQASITHTLEITEVIPPKNETDPARMREQALRKGTIIRTITADGTTKALSKAFSA